jgi:hypothetical protein
MVVLVVEEGEEAQVQRVQVAMEVMAILGVEEVAVRMILVEVQMVETVEMEQQH